MAPERSRSTHSVDCLASVSDPLGGPVYVPSAFFPNRDCEPSASVTRTDDVAGSSLSCMSQRVDQPVPKAPPVRGSREL